MLAIAGGLQAPCSRIIDPESYGILASIATLAYPIVGGMSSIWGGLPGDTTLRLLLELLRPVADYQELLFAGLVLLAVLFFPGGMAGQLAKLRKTKSTKVTAAEPGHRARHRIARHRDVRRPRCLDRPDGRSQRVGSGERGVFRLSRCLGAPVLQLPRSMASPVLFRMSKKAFLSSVGCAFRNLSTPMPDRLW